MHAVCSALHTTILLTAEADYLIAIRCGMPSATGSGVHRTASCVASHRKCIDCVLFNLKVKYIRKAMSEVIVYGIYIYAKNDVVMCLCARKFSSTFGLSLSLCVAGWLQPHENGFALKGTIVIVNYWHSIAWLRTLSSICAHTFDLRTNLERMCLLFTCWKTGNRCAASDGRWAWAIYRCCSQILACMVCPVHRHHHMDVSLYPNRFTFYAHVQRRLSNTILPPTDVTASPQEVRE